MADADPRPYLQRPSVLVPIFAAYPLITLPLAYLTLFEQGATWRFFSNVYLWGLGLSHFVITFAIYLSSKNLRYFASSPGKRVVYFGIPGLIFLYYGTIWLVDPVAHPTASTAIMVSSIVFNVATWVHLGRQSFGVLQMMKGQSGIKFDPRMRRLEQIFFFAMPVLQAQTMYWGGGKLVKDNPLVWITIAFAAVVFVTIVVLGLRSQGPKRRFVPLAYLAVQTAAVSTSLLDMRLYLAANATHYTEYHLLMYPRVMRSELGTSRVDRVMAFLRRSPFVFYGVLLAVTGVVTGFLKDWSGFATVIDAGPKPFGVFFHMMNGIFLFHFFVEAFIWKFGDPYYRSALGGLYAGAKPTPATSTQASPTAAAA